jgi:hypothetical protein
LEGKESFFENIVCSVSSGGDADLVQSGKLRSKMSSAGCGVLREFAPKYWNLSRNIE